MACSFMTFPMADACSLLTALVFGDLWLQLFQATAGEYFLGCLFGLIIGIAKPDRKCASAPIRIATGIPSHE
jgi:hypothetical protein